VPPFDIASYCSVSADYASSPVAAYLFKKEPIFNSSVLGGVVIFCLRIKTIDFPLLTKVVVVRPIGQFVPGGRRTSPFAFHFLEKSLGIILKFAAHLIRHHNAKEHC